MNTLSILIYLADISVKLSIFSIVGGLFGIFISTIMIIEHYSNSKNEFPFSKLYLTLSVFLCFTGFLIPSKSAILMIAASEVSEQVIMSEEGKEVMNDIKTILKQELNNVKQNR